MHKLTPLTAGVAVLMAGCQTAPSKAWQIVKAAPRIGPGVENPSSAYAGRLHKLLQKAGIEHKVVTFTFRYSTSLMVDAPGENTAVIYKDAASSGHPWWMMSECLWSPVWLPTQPVARQIDFYLSRPTTVISVAEFPAATPPRGSAH